MKGRFATLGVILHSVENCAITFIKRTRHIGKPSLKATTSHGITAQFLAEQSIVNAVRIVLTTISTIVPKTIPLMQEIGYNIRKAREAKNLTMARMLAQRGD